MDAICDELFLPSHLFGPAIHRYFLVLITESVDTNLDHFLEHIGLVDHIWLIMFNISYDSKDT